MAGSKGSPARSSRTNDNVFRVDGKTGEIKIVVDDFVQPNGIMFSPDERKLYVIDTGISEGPGNPAHIRVFDVDIDAGRLSNGKVFVDNLLPAGVTDGMRCDIEGNVWCAMGGAIRKKTAYVVMRPMVRCLPRFICPRRLQI